MTDINIERESGYRFRIVFSSAVIICLMLALFSGLKLETVQNTIILPESPFKSGGFFGGVASLCAYDVAAFWLIAIPLTRGVRIMTSSVVFFMRGLVTGCSLRVFFENSVPGIAVFILFSYVAVTALLLFYDAFLNLSERNGMVLRILSCLALTGAAAAIRILPMLLL